MLERGNIVVIDIETLRSAEDCGSCGARESSHVRAPMVGGHLEALRCYAGSPGPGFQPIGWGNPAALGLSIGCYWSYADSRCHFFDVYTLEEMIRGWVKKQPLLVSFNGIAFDFPLMQGLLREQANRVGLNDVLAGQETRTIDRTADYAGALIALCDAFAGLVARSYDVLAEIWKVDPQRKFERGLNSLDAIAQANGLGPKLSHGAQAPRDWQDGRYASAINYCQDDVYKTKTLFELVCAGQPILRGDGQPIGLRLPFPAEESPNATP